VSKKHRHNQTLTSCCTAAQFANQTALESSKHRKTHPSAAGGRNSKQGSNDTHQLLLHKLQTTPTSCCCCCCSPARHPSFANCAMHPCTQQATTQQTKETNKNIQTNKQHTIENHIKQQLAFDKRCRSNPKHNIHAIPRAQTGCQLGNAKRCIGGNTMMSCAQCCWRAEQQTKFKTNPAAAAAAAYLPATLPLPTEQRNPALSKQQHSKRKKQTRADRPTNNIHMKITSSSIGIQQEVQVQPQT
jgi:hypothetical protein